MASEFQFPTSPPITSGSVYVVLRNASAQVWNNTAGTFQSETDSQWSNYAIPASQLSSSGYWTADFPTAITNAGVYFWVAYFQVGGSPADADRGLFQGNLYWDGSQSGPPQPCTPAGLYASICDINDQFGGNNVIAWSDLNNTGEVDDSRIQAALNWADSTIISMFRNYGNYTTPLAPTGTDALIVTRWDAILAGTWLYLSRGLRDEDQLGNHLLKMQQQVMDEINDYRSHNKLNAAQRWPQATAPTGYAPIGWK